MSDIDDIINEAHIGLIHSQRWGSRFYPCAVALTDEQKSDLLMSTGHGRRADYLRFSPSGDLTVLGLPIAIVPDNWKGPRVLIGVKP